VWKKRKNELRPINIIQMKAVKTEIENFIMDNSWLFWYLPEDKKSKVSKELLLESVLNYGTMDECLKIIKLLGYKESLEILENAKGRKKGNYYPEIYNFFYLYLKKHA